MQQLLLRLETRPKARKHMQQQQQFQYPKEIKYTTTRWLQTLFVVLSKRQQQQQYFDKRLMAHACRKAASVYKHPCQDEECDLPHFFWWFEQNVSLDSRPNFWEAGMVVALCLDMHLAVDKVDGTIHGKPVEEYIIEQIPKYCKQNEVAGLIAAMNKGVET